MNTFFQFIVIMLVAIVSGFSLIWFMEYCIKYFNTPVPQQKPPVPPQPKPKTKGDLIFENIMADIKNFEYYWAQVTDSSKKGLVYCRFSHPNRPKYTISIETSYSSRVGGGTYIDCKVHGCDYPNLFTSNQSFLIYAAFLQINKQKRKSQEKIKIKEAEEKLNNLFPNILSNNS
jgi:hypothetical protein